MELVEINVWPSNDSGSRADTFEAMGLRLEAKPSFYPFRLLLVVIKILNHRHTVQVGICKLGANVSAFLVTLVVLANVSLGYSGWILDA